MLWTWVRIPPGPPQIHRDRLERDSLEDEGLGVSLMGQNRFDKVCQGYE